VQVGDKNERGQGAASKIDLTRQPPKQVSIGGLHRDLKNPQVMVGEKNNILPAPQKMPAGSSGYRDGGKQSLVRIKREVEQAMQGLIAQNLIVVRRKSTFLEIEIKTDILFASGVAQVSPLARPVLLKLGQILQPFDNPLRVEGHTDNLPIATAAYPSNWELSSARAASVVHVLLDAELTPGRLSVGGFGEYHPVAANDSAEGRNANRRVVLVVLAGEGEGANSVEAVLGAQVEPREPIATLAERPGTAPAHDTTARLAP